MPGMTAGQKANWGKAKFSSSGFANYSVNSNVKSIPSHGGAYTGPDKMPPKKS
jgi:hypothetical protein